LCSFGQLTKGYFEKEVNGKPKIIERDKSSYFTYIGQEVDPEQVIELSEPFRGFTYFHKLFNRTTQISQGIATQISKRAQY